MDCEGKREVERWEMGNEREKERERETKKKRGYINSDGSRFNLSRLITN